jgi:hypothetical protein
MMNGLKLLLTLIAGVVVIDKLARSKRVCMCLGPACVCNYRR